MCAFSSHNRSVYFHNIIFFWYDINYVAFDKIAMYVTVWFSRAKFASVFTFSRNQLAFVAYMLSIYVMRHPKTKVGCCGGACRQHCNYFLPGKESKHGRPRSSLIAHASCPIIAARVCLTIYRALEGQSGMSKYRSPFSCTCVSDHTGNNTGLSRSFPRVRVPIPTYLETPPLPSSFLSNPSLRTRRFEGPKVTRRRWLGKSKWP